MEWFGDRRRTPTSEDGASVVEMAVVAPILFLLVFAIIQFGIFFAQDLALSNAAREAVRAGAVPGSVGVHRGTCEDIHDAVQQGVGTIALDPADVTIAVRLSTEPPSSDRCPPALGPPVAPMSQPCFGVVAGDELYVGVSYDANLIIPLFGVRTITLQREGLSRCEFNQ